MSTDTFKRFVKDQKWQLEECLRGSGRITESSPDILAISAADSLKEQYYWFYRNIACHAWDFEDGIDWERLEKELHAHSNEVCKEWFKKKKAQDARNKNY